MPTEIERLQILMEAKLNKLERDMKKANGIVDKSTRKMERRTNQAARNMNNAFRGAFATAGALGIYLSVSQVTDYADAWTELNNQLQGTEKIIQIQLKSRRDLLELANGSGSDIDGISQLYNRTAIALREVTKEERIFATVTDTVAKSLKLGKLAASEQNSVLLQLSQAFSKGSLDGDEFKSISENAGRFMEGLSEQLGVTRGELRKMSKQGELTVDKLVAAIVKMAPEINKAFAETTPTIGRAMAVLNNEMVRYVGNLAETKGISEAVRFAITGLTNNLEVVGDTALVAGAAILGAFGPQAIAAIGRFGIALAAGTGGLTALTGGLAAAFTALHLFGDSIQPVSGELATLSDYGSATFDVLIDGAGEAASEFKNTLIAAIGTVISGLGGVEVSNQQVLHGFKALVNGALQLLLGVSNYLTETLIAAPKIFFEKVTDAANLMLKGIETGINGAIALLNKLIDAANTVGSSVGVSIGKINEIDLPELQSKFEGAGKRYGEALQKGFKNGFQDGPVTNILDEISKRANELAGERIDKKVSITPNLKTPTVTKSNIDQAKQNNFDREVANIQKRISLLQLEQRVVGKSAFEAEKARQAHSLLEAAKAANIPITENLKNKVNTLAGGYATATVKLDEMKDAQENAADRAAELESTFQDATKGIVSGLLEGRDAADVFADALGNISDRLLDLALDDFFAGLKGGGGGLLGGSTGGLFGGAIIPGIFHKGGLVGRDGGGHGRAVSPGVFNNAPRYHNGGVVGLKPDEVPAILQKGEIVIPRNFASTSQKKSGNVTIAPVYQIDARGADSGVDEKIQIALSRNNEDLQQNLPAMIQNANARGRV